MLLPFGRNVCCSRAHPFAVVASWRASTGPSGQVTLKGNDMRPSSHKRVADRFSLRTAVLLVIACALGTAAGALTYLASRSIPQAVLAACSATGGSARFLWQIAGPDRPASRLDKDRGTDVGTEEVQGPNPPTAQTAGLGSKAPTD
jgi:hypothetical protein